MASTKLDFQDGGNTVGFIDTIDTRTTNISGWVGSQRPIQSIELSANESRARTPCEYGIARPDVERRHRERFPDARNTGFQGLFPAGARTVSILITFRDGEQLQSQPRDVVEISQTRSDESYLHADVPMAKIASHANWRSELVSAANKKGMRVLEIGSRKVTGGRPMRDQFDKAEYVGFDYHPGPNVDVVGDAHRLSKHVSGKFDLVFSSAVFEHLAMPWLVAEETAKVLNIGGLVYVETHYSYSSHERPWHFFQFSEMALKVLFSSALGFECIEAGVSNPIIGRFSKLAQPYLRDRPITGLYCHSNFYGRKTRDVPDFKWQPELLAEVASETHYPEPKK